MILSYQLQRNASISDVKQKVRGDRSSVFFEMIFSCFCFFFSPSETVRPKLSGLILSPEQSLYQVSYRGSCSEQYCFFFFPLVHRSKPPSVTHHSSVFTPLSNVVDRLCFKLQRVTVLLEAGLYGKLLFDVSIRMRAYY